MFEKIKIFFCQKHVYSFILFLFFVIFSITQTNRGQDFEVFLQSAKYFLSGQSIYLSDYQTDLKYFYSPFFSVFFVPFVFLGTWGAKYLWFLCNFFFLILIYRSIYFYLDTDYLKYKKMFWFLLTLFSLRFILAVFNLGQMNLFLMFSILVGMRLVINGKIKLASLLFALGVNIKLITIVIVPYLVWKKQYKTLLWFFIWTIFFLFIPFLFLGYNEGIQTYKEWYVTTIRHSISADPSNTLSFSYDPGVYNLRSLIAQLFSEGNYVLEGFKRTIFILPEAGFIKISQALELLLVFSCVFIFGKPQNNINNKKKILIELSYLLLVAVLISPVQRKYSFVFMFPAYASLLYFYFSSLQNSQYYRRRIYIFCLLLFSYIINSLSASDIIGRYMYTIGEYYQVITYGSLLLLVLLFFINFIYKNENSINLYK
jgi:hypothetical protein